MAFALPRIKEIIDDPETEEFYGGFPFLKTAKEAYQNIQKSLEEENKAGSPPVGTKKTSREDIEDKGRQEFTLRLAGIAAAGLAVTRGAGGCEMEEERGSGYRDVSDKEIQDLINTFKESAGRMGDEYNSQIE